MLADGIDFVLLSLAGADVPPSRARSVTARCRRNGTVFAFTDAAGRPPICNLDARITAYHGIEPGYGRITGVDLEVRATARGQQPRRRTVTLSGRGGRVDWSTAAVNQDAGAAPLRVAQ
ncbi:hypothetical protein GS539_24850 [Rhodococcus hoagii]|nr:hypothetical protein [Prescottella equi]